jgi:hypothetical protein
MKGKKEKNEFANTVAKVTKAKLPRMTLKFQEKTNFRGFGAR